jgi:Uncharacterized protein conserved in bacteria
MTDNSGVPAGADQEALLQRLQAMLDAQTTTPTMTPEQVAQAQALIAQAQQAKASQDAAALIAQLQAATPPTPAPAPVAAPAVASVAAPAFAAPVAAAAPATPRKRGKGALIGILSTVAVLALVAGGLFAFGIVKLPGGATVPNEGEVFLLAADDLGPDPFSPASLVPEVTEIAPSVVTPSSSVAVPAATPGLYGGTGDKAVCDPLAQANFLAKNPDLAAAWVAALTADSTVRLRDGSALTTANISQYLAGLTPIILTSDTRVTNHGYHNGKPTIIASVLQAGTAVMVDQFGVPRVKCNCGNPLLPPKPVTGTVTYTGTPWAGWTGTPDMVQASSEPIETLTLVDVITGQQFQIPVCKPYVTSGSRFCLDPAQVTGATDAQPQPTSTPQPGADILADIPGLGDGVFETTSLGNSRLDFGTPASFVHDAATDTYTMPAVDGWVLYYKDGSTLGAKVDEIRAILSTGEPWQTGACATLLEDKAFSHDGWTGTALGYGRCTNDAGTRFDFYDLRVVAEKDGVLVTVAVVGMDEASAAAAVNTAFSTFRRI